MSAHTMPMLVVFLALALASCGPPTIAEVCDDIHDECDDYVSSEYCRFRGEELQAVAVENNCEQTMELYVECLSEDVCAWETACDGPRRELGLCVGMSL